MATITRGKKMYGWLKCSAIRMNHKIVRKPIRSKSPTRDLHFLIWKYIQGFHLRPEAGRFVRSFAIPCPVLWDQYWRFFSLLWYIWTYWLEDNRIINYILQNGHITLFSSLIERRDILLVSPLHLNGIEVTISFSWFQKRWKWRFWVFYFKNFLGEHAPRPP